MDGAYDQLALIEPRDRILLLPHCLRPSQTCPGKQSKKGLVCPPGCAEECVAGRLIRAAHTLGYKGVCVAAGGTQALRFVAEQQPRAIVAVACDKELREGVEAVRDMAGTGHEAPVIVIVPLTRDGCVDTAVDEADVLDALTLGCAPSRARLVTGRLR